MIVNFNLEKLDKLLLDIYKTTGLTVSVWDSQFNQLSYQPKEMPEFCRLIKNTKQGNKNCFCSDKFVCSMCSREKNLLPTHVTQDF